MLRHVMPNPDSYSIGLRACPTSGGGLAAVPVPLGSDSGSAVLAKLLTRGWII